MTQNDLPQCAEERDHTVATGEQIEREPAVASTQAMSITSWCALVVILVAAAVLRLWRLDQNGFGNGYYAAAVRSMLASPSNFLFGVFDPAGFITVDKPPGAIWVQATSAALFGYYGLSLLVPQALMGIATVGIVFQQIRRLFGTLSGLIAASVLAVTPIAVAVDRDNLPDSLLTLLLVIAAGTLIRSISSDTWKPLAWTMVLIGAAFNVKMLAAFVILPTFYVVYLGCAAGSWRNKLIRLSGATAVLVGVSLSWSLVVELTPTTQRPYVGGSRTNSALELALGYNGWGRIFGGSGNIGRPGSRDRSRDADDTLKPNQKPDVEQNARGNAGGRSFPGVVGIPPEAPVAGTPFNFRPPFAGGEPIGGFGGLRNGGGERRGRFGGPRGGFGGAPGLMRFSEEVLSEQITWLIPLAFFGACAGLLAIGFRLACSQEQASILMWVGWLTTHLLLFSFARGIFHEYYTIIMGPAVAALVGIGLPALWRSFQCDDWQRALLPAALIVTGSWQAYVIGRHPELRYNLLPISLGCCCLGAAAIVGSRWISEGMRNRACLSAGVSVGITALIIAPATWSVTTMLSPGFSMLPAANVHLLTQQDEQRPRMPGPGPGPFAELSAERVTPVVEFLRSERKGESYLVASSGSMEVQSIIIHTGEPAIALGGFMGADPVLTKDQFVKLVHEGKLRFVLVGGPGPGGGMPFGPPDNAAIPELGKNSDELAQFGGPFPNFGGGPGEPMTRANNEIMEWVRENGKPVDPKLWQATDAVADAPAIFGRRGRGPRQSQLFDLKPVTNELTDARREE